MNNKEQSKTTHFRTWKSGKSWLYASAALLVLGAGASAVAVHATTTKATLPPAADVYAGASTGTASTTTNFGKEAHATISLAPTLQMAFGHNGSLQHILGGDALAPSAPVAGAPTVLGDEVTDPMGYFFYNHTAQAVTATASLGVMASQASAQAWQNPTAANKSLANVVSSAAAAASSMTQQIIGSLGSLETEASSYYADYQKALVEYNTNGSTASYKAEMAQANSLYAEVATWGGHVSAVANGSIAASAGSSMAYSVSDNPAAYHSAGSAYGLEGEQGLIGAPSTSSKPASGLVAVASSALNQMTALSSAADVTTGATAEGKAGALGLYATAPISLAVGAKFDTSITSAFTIKSGAAASAVVAGNAYDNVLAFYTDYYETAGQNGKFEALLTPDSTVYATAADATAQKNGMKKTVLNGSAKLTETGAVNTAKAGTYPVTFTLSIPGSKIPAATVKTTVVVGGGVATKPITVSYDAHVQRIGWQKAVSNGAQAGTTGQALRMEAAQIKVSNLPAGVTGGIEYKAHVQRVGWQGWKANGATAGTTGQALREEAIQIKLTGNLASKYDVVYRAHVQRKGWMPWVKDGATAGTTGQALRMEALEVKLVAK